VALTAQTFVGVCSGLYSWSDILGNSYLAVGTEQRLEIFDGGTLYDITPVLRTNNVAVSFSTIATSNVVSITDSTYSPTPGDWIDLLTPVSVGGIVLFGYYQIQTAAGATYTILSTTPATSTVTNGGQVPQFSTAITTPNITVTFPNNGEATGSIFNIEVPLTIATVLLTGQYNVTGATTNTFTFVASTIANANASAYQNGGLAQIEYLIPSGYAVNTTLGGYGIGDYGAGDYGLSNTAAPAGAGVGGIGGAGGDLDGNQLVIPLRAWSFGNFGEDLIASPSNGGIYYWTPPNVFAPAIVVPNSPLYSTSMFLMPQVEMIISLGAEIGGVQEPLLTRWCDEGDFTDWTASATNQAGSYFYPTGSKLVGGLSTGLGALVWTDIDIWSMTYLGYPLVFGFNRIAPNCGLISARAAGTTGSLVMWLSNRGFFNLQIGGGVTSIECPVWDFFFYNVDLGQTDQIHCAVNALFNEMCWFFPIAATSFIASTTAPLGYVKYNYVENCWDYGQSSQYQRTAWIGRSPIGFPIGADHMGLLQQHELGYDANGTPMVGGWSTGNFDLTDGEDFPFIDLIIPDFNLNTNTGQIPITPPVINMSVTAVDYPLATTPQVLGPFTINTAIGGTQFIPLRVRAREISISATWSDLGSFNRFGALRYRYAPDGRA
jgi:hypothetical protein